MKGFIFGILVVAAGCYLVTQIDAVRNMLHNYLPQQQIADASNDLLELVEQKLQQGSLKQNAKYQQKIEVLEQQIAQLNQQMLSLQQTNRLKLAALKDDNVAQQSAPIPEHSTASVKAKSRENDGLNLPTSLTEVKAITANNEADTGFKILHNTFGEEAINSRHKQASLQDIAARMEQMSVQVSRGAY